MLARMSRPAAWAFPLLFLLATAAPAQAITFFNSPSGNIGCVIGKTGARCDIRERSWHPPPKPSWCHLDWGQGLSIAGHQALGYGRSIQRGRFRCASRTSGIRCVNRRNGHGFKLSRQQRRRF